MAPCSPLLRFASRWRGLALACAGIAVAAAQEAPAPLNLTLAQAQRRALQRNADFRIAEVQVAAALAQRRIVREFPNPTLGLLASKISTDGTPEGTESGNSLLNRSYDSIASLSQLFLIGKRRLQQEAATAGVHSAQFLRDDARRLMLQAVTQAYAAALAAQKESEVLQDSAVKLRREADIAAARFKAGDLSESDEAQLQIAADQDELSADAERAAATTAVVTLEILLGESRPSGTTVLADSLEAWMDEIPAGLAEEPPHSRPDIAAAEAAVSQADTNVRLQERQRVPDVTASIQYERNPPAQPNTVGVGLSLPLPLWNRFNGEILAAKAAHEQTEVQLDKVRIQAAAEVAAARVAYHEAFQRSRRYGSSLVPKSAGVAKSVAYAYRKGQASLVALLEAERNDNLIRLAAAQAQADAASAAASLQAALGLLGPPDGP